MIIPKSSSSTNFVPNAQICIFIIFCIGVAASILLVIGAVIAAAYVLTLAIQTIFATIQTISTLYSHSDCFTQFLILCMIGYLIFRVVRSIRKTAR